MALTSLHVKKLYLTDVQIYNYNSMVDFISYEI